MDRVDEEEASDSLCSSPPYSKWPTKIPMGASHTQISSERVTSGNRIHTPKSVGFGGVEFAESNDCNQSDAPSPSGNDLADDSCRQLSCDQTGALVLTYLQRGARVLYNSSIHEWIFWFRCGDQSKMTRWATSCLKTFLVTVPFGGGICAELAARHLGRESNIRRQLRLECKPFTNIDQKR
jgi:hypothetical protein